MSEVCHTTDQSRHAVPQSGFVRTDADACVCVRGTRASDATEARGTSAAFPHADRGGSFSSRPVAHEHKMATDQMRVRGMQLRVGHACVRGAKHAMKTGDVHTPSLSQGAWPHVAFAQQRSVHNTTPRFPQKGYDSASTECKRIQKNASAAVGGLSAAVACFLVPAVIRERCAVELRRSGGSRRCPLRLRQRADLAPVVQTSF